MINGDIRHRAMAGVPNGVKRVVTSVVLVAMLVACGSDSDPDVADSFVADIRAAVAAVEADLGSPQTYFEITATPQLTNVFVAIDDATAAIPYVFLDGELQPPGPKINGAEGQTFPASAIDLDERTALDGIRADLPTSTVDAFSVEGGPGGFVRYVVSVRSQQGGVLDVVVSSSGAVIEVDPL